MKNVGQRDGATAVLAFVTGNGRTAAIRKLVGFDKVWLRAGDSSTVTIAVPPVGFTTLSCHSCCSHHIYKRLIRPEQARALSVVDEEGRRWMRAGKRLLVVGDGAPATCELRITGADTEIM